uniref:MYND-type domain-containing protein n=1 Tax=Anopheles farauti TaxID=69004 RepID=A0A182Q7F1_9DIPT
MIDFATVVPSRSCRNDEKLVAHIMQYMRRALQELPTMPLLDILLLTIKDNQYALLLLKNPNLPLSHTSYMLRLLELMNIFLAYCEPGTGFVAEALLYRAAIAFLYRQDEHAIFNYQLVGEINPALGRMFMGGVVGQMAQMRLLNRPKNEFNNAMLILPIMADVRCNSKAPYGRLLRPTWSLPKDASFVRERPFVRLLIADRHVRCDYCLAYAPFTLIPCRSCSLVMYCSTRCYDRAQNEYHKVECSLGSILRSQFGNAEFLAARVTIRLYHLFNDIDVLTTYIRNLPRSIPHASYEIPGGVAGRFAEESYMKLYFLATNRSKLSRAELKRDGINACKIAQMIQRHLNLGNGELLLAELMVRHLQIARTNALTLYRAVDDPAVAAPAAPGNTPFAMVLTTTGSMFNHSNEPNVDYTLAVDGAIAFKTKRNIPRDEQLFINYCGGRKRGISPGKKSAVGQTV